MPVAELNHFNFSGTWRLSGLEITSFNPKEDRKSIRPRVPAKLSRLISPYHSSSFPTLVHKRSFYFEKKRLASGTDIQLEIIYCCLIQRFPVCSIRLLSQFVPPLPAVTSSYRTNNFEQLAKFPIEGKVQQYHRHQSHVNIADKGNENAMASHAAVHTQVHATPSYAYPHGSWSIPPAGFASCNSMSSHSHSSNSSTTSSSSNSSNASITSPTGTGGGFLAPPGGRKYTSRTGNPYQSAVAKRRTNAIASGVREPRAPAAQPESGTEPERTPRRRVIVAVRIL